jgi:predicted component of type VI protein secretion system
MDDACQPPSVPCHSLQGPHREQEYDGELPSAFVPLRLMLQPGGLCLELTRPDMLIGRHSEADIRLALPDISRRHCRCHFADGHWHIRDLNSLNGIFVNKQRLHEGTLYDGDRLQLASLTFVVAIPDQPSIVPLPTRDADKRKQRRAS